MTQTYSAVAAKLFDFQASKEFITSSTFAEMDEDQNGKVNNSKKIGAPQSVFILPHDIRVEMVCFPYIFSPRWPFFLSLSLSLSFFSLPGDPVYIFRWPWTSSQRPFLPGNSLARCSLSRSSISLLRMSKENKVALPQNYWYLCWGGVKKTSTSTGF